MDKRIATVDLVNRHPTAMRRKRVEPAPGTRVRAIYDMLLARPCQPTRLPSTSAPFVVALQDGYGLHITRWRDGRYVLLGRWIGADYLNLRTGQITPQRDL